MMNVLEHIEDDLIFIWNYKKGCWLTKGIELLLNIYFRFNEIFNKMNVRLPRLSVLAVAKKQL